jgi:hypothetical protein
MNLPYILQRLEYSGGNPRIGVFDTDSQYADEIDLGLGYDIPGFGFWTDKRYCRCGAKITKQKPSEDFDPVLAVNLNYMCPDCAKGDQLNWCTLYGVWRDDKVKIGCHQCYKWSSECVNGYCLYVAALTLAPSELKVGITRLGRKNQRAAEAGYTFMGVLMPEGRNSLSLPEAEFLEKQIFSGQAISVGSQVLKINERFTRDLGMVGSELTRRLTYDSLLCNPTDEDRRRFTEIVEKVTQLANARCTNYVADDAAAGLTPLTLGEIVEDQGVQVEREELEKLNYNDLVGMKSKTFKGRRYRRIPTGNKIIGVKGPCIVLNSQGAPLVFRLNKHSIAGREIFNPISIIDHKTDDKETNLDWF